MARQKLVESFQVDTSAIRKISLKESNGQPILLEDLEGKTHKCVAAYTFPISRPDQKNLNERVYTSKLWEKVIREKQGEGSFGLMDHPEGEGSVKDGWTVWKNLRFAKDESTGEKLVVCDAYLFGPWGRQVNEAIEAGGRIGLSSVGYGDFKKDGFTVEEETYELDRVADHVLNPSYQVFGDGNSPVAVSESTLKKKETINSKEDTSDPQEKVRMSSAQALEEKNFRLSMKNFIADADNITDLKEKISSYEEILTYFEGVDFAEDMEIHVTESLKSAREEYDELAAKGTKLDEATTSAKEASEKVEEATEKLESLENENAQLQEKLSSAYELLDSFKTYTNKLKELHKIAEAKANGMISAKEYKELLVFTEAKESELEETQKEFLKARKIIRKMEEAVSKKDDLPLSEKFEEILKRDDLKENYPIKKTKKVVAEQDNANYVNDDDDAEDNAEDDVEDELNNDDMEYQENVNKLLDEAIPSIANYYLRMEQAYPAIYKIAEDILTRRTLMEAQQKFLRLKSLVDDQDTRYERRSILVEDEEKAGTKKRNISNHPLPKRKGWA